MQRKDKQTKKSVPDTESQVSLSLHFKETPLVCCVPHMREHELESSDNLKVWRKWM